MTFELPILVREDVLRLNMFYFKGTTTLPQGLLSTTERPVVPTSYLQSMAASSRSLPTAAGVLSDALGTLVIEITIRPSTVSVIEKCQLVVRVDVFFRLACRRFLD